MVFYSTSIYLLAWQDLTVHASVLSASCNLQLSYAEDPIAAINTLLYPRIAYDEHAERTYIAEIDEGPNTRAGKPLFTCKPPNKRWQSCSKRNTGSIPLLATHFHYVLGVSTPFPIELDCSGPNKIKAALLTL
jgi:hypothetical protein